MVTGTIRLKTGRQCHAIAIYCMKLGITEPLEERVKTFAGAGILIRGLQRRLKYGKTG